MLQVRDIPRHTPSPGDARVAVLFSGGIDSTVLAYFAHQHLPLSEPVDLLNVAFENPRRERARSAKTNKPDRKSNQVDEDVLLPAANGGGAYMVPDRVTGLTEVEELKRVCPGRTWNFVEINVPFEETQAARSVVEALMWPSRTVMDLSLANALYFASRGVGVVDGRPYTSPAKVLLNGFGSDELMGGYGRHRSVFNSGGWPALIAELQLEIDRIPTRNVGRDDRVISAHGKETRHPFLSLSLVSYLAGLPVHLKTDLRAPPGIGDKMLLRLAARKLNLVEVSTRKKKAMQFGTHSARMEGGATEKKGTLLVG
ncbi:asparagine synthase [Punctularia strigosozonata HHB-11173 SS5]|uniref:asparagine synthase n=1 Tax=Punctularia strigosozonata (strain HHB-11173) TaxID=741275 RepID=UPI00044183C6|nr:asparagine synthase [Punctularia strigosozonata HHB-11173 SS5]EIN13561.1 asparagine synthase [Punctularia strigosozonata HHB-11173 SS5]